MRRIVAILLTMMCLCVVRAQEFHCTVQVNYQKLLTTTQAYSSDADQKVFESMRQAIEDFVNGRRWTGIEFAQGEQIECSMAIILSSRTTATDFAGQLQIQMRRPVYNSTYTTGLFNYLEQGFTFSYNESQPLDFDLGNFYGNLSSTIGYYCYLMLGIYFDSFGLDGGAPFYEMAQQVQQAAEQSGFPGWSQDGQKNRYWFMENHINSAYASLHQAYYDYHRLGLDMMTKDQEEGRRNIIGALQDLAQVHRTRTSLLSVQQFVDVKMEELISIFGPARPEEQKQVYTLIKEISPVNVAKLKGFNTR